MIQLEKKRLSIGEMAELNHTTIPTLRLYDRLGLLPPAFVDQFSRYRYYDIKQNARFDMIQYMKELGMGLREIKEVLDREELDAIKEVLIRKRDSNEEKIKNLRLQREAINRTIAGIERYKKSPAPGTLTLEYIERRRIYTMRTEVNFYDHDIDTYELVLKQLKAQLLNSGLPEIYYCNAGTFLSRENFLRQRFFSDKIFIFVYNSFPEGHTEVLENGMYACIYADDFDSEKEYAGRLLAFCEKNGYSPCGDYICEVLAEYEIFGGSHRSMFLRLQVPVEFPSRQPV